jgi:hypothetical protein
MPCRPAGLARTSSLQTATRTDPVLGPQPYPGSLPGPNKTRRQKNGPFKSIEDLREARDPLGRQRASLTQLPRVRWVLRKESSWLAARRSVEIADHANLAAVRRDMQRLVVPKEMVQTASR